MHKKEKISNTLIAFLATCLFFWGCKFKATEAPGDLHDDDVSIYVHDFGVVRPQSEQVHFFEVKNSSDSEWKIRKVVQNCSCTVAKISSLSVPPGETLNVELSYRAGKGFADETRDSVVYFEQEDIGPITLRVKAQIRPQITLQPPHYSLSSYVPNDRPSGQFLLQDWSDDGLKEVEFISEEPWISVSSPKKGDQHDTGVKLQIPNEKSSKCIGNPG